MRSDVDTVIALEQAAIEITPDDRAHSTHAVEVGADHEDGAATSGGLARGVIGRSDS
jgi:hypothetical protein